MAIYFGKFDILPRINPNTLKTQSAVAKSAYQDCGKLRHFEVSAQAAYIAGDLLEVRGKGKIHDYSKKGGVQFSQIYLPDQAPINFYDRQILWNAVELAEKRKDSQLCRTFIGALPIELTLEQNIELLEDYIQTNFTGHGMIVDCAVHDPDHKVKNPHVHLMITMRDVTPDGFGNKNRDWNKKEVLKSWRADWARVQNQALERAGFDIEKVAIDHRSYKEQGSGLKPQIHEGKDATQLRRKGVLTEVAKYNQEVKKYNMIYKQEIENAKAELTADFDEKIKALYQTLEVEPKGEQQPPEILKEGEKVRILYDADSSEKGQNQEQVTGASPDIATVEPIEEEAVIFANLQNLKSVYLQNSYATASHEDIISQTNSDLQTISGQQDDLRERLEAITRFRHEQESIAKDSENTGPFNIFEKRKLEERGKRAERSLQQAVDALKSDYDLTPDKIPDLMAYNHQIKVRYAKSQAEAVERLSGLEREKAHLLESYKKVLAEHPNLSQIPAMHQDVELDQLDPSSKQMIQKVEGLFANLQKPTQPEKQAEQVIDQGLEIE